MSAIYTHITPLNQSYNLESNLISNSFWKSIRINKLSEVGREDFQKWNRSAQKVDFVIAGSIKFENLIAGGCKTVIHIVIQKSGQNTKKPQQKHFYCGFEWCHRDLFCQIREWWKVWKIYIIHWYSNKSQIVVSEFISFKSWKCSTNVVPSPRLLLYLLYEL